MGADPLARFVAAQAGGVYEAALGELAAGRKTGHWIWFVFPQLAGLGHSETARFYALSDLAEARAYARHGVLGPRLREATRAMLGWAGRRSADDILGALDAMKLRSAMTLFAAACPGQPLFGALLDAQFGGARDPLTLAHLQPAGAPT